MPRLSHSEIRMQAMTNVSQSPEPTNHAIQLPYRPLFRRPLFRHIWPMWRDLGPAEKGPAEESQYATLFSRVSPIFDQLKCFSYHYEPCPTIKHFRKQDIVKIENLATRQMWRDLGPAE